MPIYEYMCTNASCAHELEALQKISDEPLVYCPACGEASLKKKISAAAFRLKGTGWYETDFKNSGKKKDAQSEGGDSKSSGDGAKSGGDGASNTSAGEGTKTPAKSGGGSPGSTAAA